MSLADMSSAERQREGGRLISEVRSRHPSVREAVLADMRMTAAHRLERYEFRSRLDVALQALRLTWTSDAFLSQVLYRVKARLQALGIPVLPRLAHRASMALAQVTIGDAVLVHPGVYIVHGQVVIDSFAEIHPGVVISPFVTIGTRGDLMGPTIGPNVHIGTGAKVIGGLHVGAGARIGANAVVLDDVPEGTTVVGAPARPTAGAELDSNAEPDVR